MPKYDPEAAVAEFEATLAELHAKLPTDTELRELLWLAHTATAKFAAGQVRKLLLAAYEAGCRYRNSGKAQYMDGFNAGKLEAWSNAGEAVKFCSDTSSMRIEAAARADGVEL